jgi:3-isopropylmalate/(R)-2-methylmalate dehydratase small subunit
MPMQNIDTDKIIPARFLKTIKRFGLGVHLFDPLRFDKDGNEKPDFVLNQEPFRKAQVIIAHENFGCGSSREHAVWALQDFGFQAVVSPRFADIFRGNCVSSGLVPVEASEEAVGRLFAALAADGAAAVVVDLAARTVAIPSAGVSEPFTIADFAQWRLLEGLDDVALTLRYEASISAFEAGRPSWLPSAAANAPAAS